MSDKEPSCRLDRVIARLLGEFEFRPRIQGVFGGGVEFGAEFWVPQHSEEVHQFTVDVVVDLDLARFLCQKHSRRAAKGFTVGLVRGELAHDPRRKLRLAAEIIERRRNAHA
jgi:hypothetical protein